MGPEGVVKSKISKFLFVILIVKTSCGSDHINTKLAVKGDFSLVKGSDSDTDFNTHFKIKNFIIMKVAK